MTNEPMTVRSATAPCRVAWLVALGVLSGSRVPAQEAAPAPTGAPKTTARADLGEAQRLVRAGDLAQAEKTLAELATSFSDDPALLLLHGEVLLAMERPEEAIRPLRQSLELDPAPPRLHFQLASALAATGDRPGALAEFAAALAQSDDPQIVTMARLNRALLLQAERNWTAAAEELEQVLALAPEQSQVYGDLAGVYCEAGSLPEARRTLDRGMERGFRSAVHFSELGARYFKRKAYDDARDAFSRAIEIDAAHAASVRGLAAALDQLGRTGEANEQLRRFLELVPDDPDAGEIRKRLGPQKKG